MIALIDALEPQRTYFSPSISALLLQPAEPSAEQELTPRQVEIVKLLVLGRSAAEVASGLGLSPKTGGAPHTHQAAAGIDSVISDTASFRMASSHSSQTSS